MNTQTRIFKPIPDRLNEISGAIVDSALTIHRYFGPGLLESIYEECLIIELEDRGFKVESQVTLPVDYKEHRLKKGLKLDIIVEKSVIVEIKSVDQILSIHELQLLTYLKVTNCRLGLIINFNAKLIKDGIKRIVH